MIKLADILLEIEAEPVITDLGNLDDEIKNAIEKAPKTEIIGTISLALAIPGIINAIMKIIEAIVKKSEKVFKFNLSKSGDPEPKTTEAWYKIIEKVTEEIDRYVDTPFNIMLRPFISDRVKREKMAKLLKAVVLTLLVVYASTYGAIDTTKIKDTTNLITQLSKDVGLDLGAHFGQTYAVSIGEFIKKLPEILKPAFDFILQVAK